jgi:hypothetical protein
MCCVVRRKKFIPLIEGGLSTFSKIYPLDESNCLKITFILKRPQRDDLSSIERNTELAVLVNHQRREDLMMSQTFVILEAYSVTKAEKSVSETLVFVKIPKKFYEHEREL